MTTPATPEITAALDRYDRAEIVRRVLEIQEALTRIMDVVMPEGEPRVCPHPPDKVVEDATMDDDPSRYTCTLCGATSHLPFPTIT